MNHDYIKTVFKNKLIRGSMYTVSSTVINHIISMVATIFIFTKLLSPQDYGEIINYTLWLSIFTTIVTLNLSSSVVRAKVEFGENYDSFLSSIFILGSILSVIFLLFVFIFKGSLLKVMSMNSNMLILLVINSFFMFIFNCYTIKFTATYNFKIYNRVMISYSIIAVGLSVILIKIMKSNIYYGRIYGLFITSCIFASYFYFNQIKLGKKFIQLKYWKFALCLSIPLLFHALSGTMLNYFDNIIIKHFESNNIIQKGSAGLYGFGYNIALIISILWGAFNKVWVPWFFEKMEKAEYKLIKCIQKYYVWFFTLLFISFIMVVPEFLLLIKKDYREVKNIIPIISFGYYFLFMYSFPANVEFYYKKTQYMSFGAMLSVAINAGLNILLIPIYGYGVASITTLISYIVLFLYHYVIVRFVLHETILEINIFIKAIGFSLVSVILYYRYISNIFVRYIFLIIVIGISVMLIIKNEKLKNNIMGREKND